MENNPDTGSPVLVVYAHPFHTRSRVNRTLVESISGIEGVFVNDLYQVYPEMEMDVDREKALLEPARLIVFQHPLYWYGAPAILKQWLDAVLEYGYAYGPGGTALRGKALMHVVSCGGAEWDYSTEAIHGEQITEYLKPFRQTAKFCGMTCRDPLVVYGASSLGTEQLSRHCGEYRQCLEEFNARDAASGV